MSFAALVDPIVAAGRVRGDDVLALRKAFYGDDAVISEAEADALFVVNDACDDVDEAWHTFFIEALSDFLVNQMVPRGYIAEDNAAWLIERISRDGVVKSACELELLVKSMEIAKGVPQSLEQFALEQVKQAVLNGDGVTRSGLHLEAGRVTEGDVEMMRRIMYAYGCGDNIAVTRAEAEMLFDVSDATRNADNHPSWPDLFVKALANHVMMFSGYRAPSREDALKRETWLNDADVDVGGFFSKMLSGGLRGVLSAYSRDAGWHETQNAHRQAMSEAAERIEGHEAAWLVERINRYGELGLNEMALLRFIRDESPDIHPDIKPLLEKVA